MKIKIEIVTGAYTYHCWTWKKESEETASETERELAQKFIEADEDDRQEIAYELRDYAQQVDEFPEPYFSSVEVSYPDGEHQNEDIQPDDAVDNDIQDIHDHFIKEWRDRTNKIVLLIDDQWKRRSYEAEVNSKTPFNVHALSVVNGSITYGTDEVEYVDGGEGNATDYFWRVR